MLKRSLPSLPRRLAAGALVATLTAGAGIAAWAAQPAVAQPELARQNIPGAENYTAHTGEEIDASAPVLITGEVTHLELSADHIQVESTEDGSPHITSSGNATFFIHITDENTGQPWIVSGAKSGGVTDEQLSGLDGQRVTIRAYQTVDKTCDPACRADGRDIMLAEG